MSKYNEIFRIVEKKLTHFQFKTQIETEVHQFNHKMNSYMNDLYKIILYKIGVLRDKVIESRNKRLAK